ncbi:MAG: methionyl-tRNA formyltransferase [Candidatus Saccharibacteria bacterium]
MSKKILFFGNEKLATGVTTKSKTFRGLIDAGYEIKALIIAQKLDKNSDQLEIVKIAKQNNIEIKSYPNLKQATEEIASFNVDAAVLAAYGKMVPKEIIDIFKIGIINIHPSLLPKHRGSTPIESTIIDGDTEAGVSIMKLSVDMDSGPVYKQTSIKLTGNETKQELCDKLDELGKDLLLSCLEDILTGKLEPSSQPKDGVTYDKLVSKEDGIIDWHSSWKQIDGKIRAYSGWPKAHFNLSGMDITLLKAHLDNQNGEPGQAISQGSSLAVYCSDGLVVVDSLIPAGSKPMSGKDFLLGYGSKIL